MNLLIDGSSLIWRTHYANKAKNQASVENNIYLFLKSLKSYATMYNSRNIYIAWDKKMGTEKNFRMTETEGTYKGNRDKDAATIVYEAQPKIEEITKLLGCKNLYPWIMEADDIIAWLSKNLDGQSIIITTDQDMLQLINNKTCVYHPRKKNIIDHLNFEKEIGIPIEHFLPYKAINGDKSDNIPGIKGYGPVLSKRLAKQWVTDKSQISDDKVSIIEKNIQLMDLANGYSMSGTKEAEFYKEQLDSQENLKADIQLFENLCKEYKYKSIINDMDKWKSAFGEPYLLSIFNNM